ncbi:hypothetical protein A2886_00020 [candidate division WWE3 bacterium RIFCSPHIGHO2_01_FULL_42_13]|uniref:Glycosyltransferase RgtA/B/C/D-like domain-containing protein n=1 Tax=candidate division WWE3 bacterium RIFCSPHIGHO2_01_FULL_42_13 TaxID=1802617 RepID=A0A1F4UQZ9_UNCKA|nr:MAG: hypothetical protein A2886_00020 [candidate division WWE3 bacterium RIFCSPHIGHO2_01_FULL_42_13]
MPKKPLIFIISLVVLTGIIGFGPLLIPPTNPFYNIDPETAFISNSLEFLESGRIDYYGHPGTPVIILLAHLFSILKYPVEILGQNFVQWSLVHYREIFWISRAYFFLLFTIGNFILHFCVYKHFRSFLVNLFLFVILFLDPSFQEISTKVATEPLAFLLFSLWLISFLAYIKTQKTKALFCMALISGVLVADKLIYTPVAVASLLFTLKQKKLSVGIALFLLAFFTATLPTMRNYPKLASWLFNISTKSGIYGTGTPGLIDRKLFIQSASYWINTRPGFILLLLFVLIGVFRSGKERSWKLITITALLGFLFFMKYPAARYQSGTVLLLFTSAIYVFTHLSKHKQLLFLLLFSVPAFFYGSHDFQYKRGLVLKASNLQVFIDHLPPDEDIVWEYAEAEDFALIRARNDSGYFISPQLRVIKPHMWELVSQTLTDVRNNKDESFDISCLCWDGIVMQKSSYSIFISKQRDTNLFLTEHIPGTEMLYIKRNNL